MRNAPLLRNLVGAVLMNQPSQYANMTVEPLHMV